MVTDKEGKEVLATQIGVAAKMVRKNWPTCLARINTVIFQSEHGE